MDGKSKRQSWMAGGGKFTRTRNGYRIFNRNGLEVHRADFEVLQVGTLRWMTLLNCKSAAQWEAEASAAHARYSRLAEKYARARAQLDALERYVVLKGGSIPCEENKNEEVPF